MEKNFSKVLIIEDEVRMRRLITMLLSDMPLEFVEAEDGRQGIEVFKGGGFDLVITDFKLPGANGMAVLKHIKQRHPDLPVIVITAFGSPEFEANIMRQGAFGFVAKPFKEEHLRQCVVSALGRSRPDH